MNDTTIDHIEPNKRQSKRRIRTMLRAVIEWWIKRKIDHRMRFIQTKWHNMTWSFDGFWTFSFHFIQSMSLFFNISHMLPAPKIPFHCIYLSSHPLYMDYFFFPSSVSLEGMFIISFIGVLTVSCWHVFDDQFSSTVFRFFILWLYSFTFIDNNNKSNAKKKILY